VGVGGGGRKIAGQQWRVRVERGVEQVGCIFDVGKVARRGAVRGRDGGGEDVFAGGKRQARGGEEERGGEDKRVGERNAGKEEWEVIRGV